MEWSAKNIFWNTGVRTVLFLCLAFVVPFFELKHGIDEANPYFVISVSVDIAGMLVAYVLMVGLYTDSKISGRNTFYLLGLVITTYVSLFSDAIGWIVQDKPNYILINHISSLVYYVADLLQAFFFWRYTLTYLKVKNRKIILADKWGQICFLISLVLIILNLKFGFYYTISSEGDYARSSYNWLSIVYSLIMLIMSLGVVVIERKQLRGFQIVAFFLYASGPLIAAWISTFTFGLSLNPAVSIISILLMYCVLNVLEGDAKAVADNEISIASSIQENVLPKTFPYLPDRKEFDIYAIMKPAKEVGGDFYDFFMVDEKRMALVIADVSGKGIPAALFMMTSRTLIKNRLQAGDDLSHIMEDVNNQLCEGNVADLFITVWVCIIDLTTGHCKSVNAGHEYPVLRRAGGKYELIIKKHSLAVAMFEGTKFGVDEFDMHPGDSIFVYTDGVTEAMNRKNQLFSKERLVDVLNRNPESKPKEAIEGVLGAISDFVKDVEQFDDTTMLCMTYYGPR